MVLEVGSEIMLRNEVDRTKLSPVMLQWMNIKDENPDAIIFFRLGDFYEMFFDDAILASKVLELTLTGKQAGLEERVPMCGVPHHAISSFLQVCRRLSRRHNSLDNQNYCYLTNNRKTQLYSD